MSTKSTMTRDEAVAAVGLEAVDAVERENCEPTSRAQTDGDDRIEWAASVDVTGPGGLPARLTAYYYTSPDELIDEDGNPLEDLSSVDWVVDGYDVK